MKCLDNQVMFDEEWLINFAFTGWELIQVAFCIIDQMFVFY